MRNYDASEVGNPYTRVPEIQISYAPDMSATIKCKEVLAIKTLNGDFLQLSDEGELSFNLSGSDYSESVQIVNPATGADVPGMTVTIQQVMLSILAVIRSRQKIRDNQ